LAIPGEDSDWTRGNPPNAGAGAAEQIIEYRTSPYSFWHRAKLKREETIHTYTHREREREKEAGTY